jgi:hypothetical protein
MTTKEDMERLFPHRDKKEGIIIENMQYSLTPL